MEQYAKDLDIFVKKYMPVDNLKYYRWNIEDLKAELHQLEKQVAKYETDIYMYNIIKAYVEPADNQYVSILDDEESGIEISYQIFKDIYWLKEWINNYGNKFWSKSPSFDDTKRYENINEKFANLKEIYVKLMEQDNDAGPVNLAFIFYYNTDTMNTTETADKTAYLTAASELLDRYEMFGYYVINRFEEYEYDLNVYGDYFTQEISYKWDLLNILVQHHAVALTKN